MWKWNKSCTGLSTVAGPKGPVASCSGAGASVCLLVPSHVRHGRVQRGELCCLAAHRTCDTAYPPHWEKPTPLARQNGAGQLLSSPSITLGASFQSGLPIKGP
ncbi:hypothetical protein EYF80_000438 [Liparis tanakae]|uniref:Uncharacterized protein n=1 Tax=Liparis tanakae TaxID=230148 RepID=A0A4Z2JG46_9TELE|nr:hypothetical protein EYF80_000438 [Liparis tanakae]